jgi:hypothetical protein
MSSDTFCQDVLYKYSNIRPLVHHFQGHPQGRIRPHRRLRKGLHAGTFPPGRPQGIAPTMVRGRFVGPFVHCRGNPCGRPGKVTDPSVRTGVNAYGASPYIASFSLDATYKMRYNSKGYRKISLERGHQNNS